MSYTRDIWRPLLIDMEEIQTKKSLIDHPEQNWQGNQHNNSPHGMHVIFQPFICRSNIGLYQASEHLSLNLLARVISFSLFFYFYHGKYY